jgi:hypothetical protein
LCLVFIVVSDFEQEQTEGTEFSNFISVLSVFSCLTLAFIIGWLSLITDHWLRRSKLLGIMAPTKPRPARLCPSLRPIPRTTGRDFARGGFFLMMSSSS